MLVNRNTLSTALTAAARVASSRSALPVLANVKLTAAQNRLTLEVTDLERALSQEIPAQSEADLWATTVDAKKLAEIVAVMDGADVELTHDDRRTRLTVKSGGAVVELPGIDARQFPPFPVMPEGVTVDAAAFCDAVSRVVCAASTEEARPVLQGVYIDPFMMVATDGFRIHTTKFFWLKDGVQSEDEIKAAAAKFGKTIVPAKSLTEAAKLFTKCKSVTVSVTNGQWFISGSSTTLVSQTIEGSYPDFGAIIPKQSMATITADVVRLSAGVKRVLLLAANGVVKFEAGAELRLSGQSEATGAAEDTMPVTLEGTPKPWALNGRFVLDALACARRNPVKIAVNAPNTPVKVTDDSGWVAVIMPMAVQP